MALRGDRVLRCRLTAFCPCHPRGSRPGLLADVSPASAAGTTERDGRGFRLERLAAPRTGAHALRQRTRGCWPAPGSGRHQTKSHTPMWRGTSTPLPIGLSARSCRRCRPRASGAPASCSEPRGNHCNLRCPPAITTPQARTCAPSSDTADVLWHRRCSWPGEQPLSRQVLMLSGGERPCARWLGGGVVVGRAGRSTDHPDLVNTSGIRIAADDALLDL